MKFILKICLFALLLMISKYTRVDEKTLKHERQLPQNKLTTYNKTGNLTNTTKDEKKRLNTIYY